MSERTIKCATPAGEILCSLIDVPDVCPICHHAVESRLVEAYFTSARAKEKGQILFQCSKRGCKSYFIAYYDAVSGDSSHIVCRLSHCKPQLPKGRTFEDSIVSLSPDFISLYSQASSAEQAGLDQICGPGYKRALECLIKDYLLSAYPDKRNVIEQSRLDQCMSKYIPDPRIKARAERTSSLEHGDVSCARKWTAKETEDLKGLTDLVVHWIMMEILARKYE